MKSRGESLTLASVLLVCLHAYSFTAEERASWELDARSAVAHGDLMTARKSAENALRHNLDVPVAHELLGHIAYLEKSNEEASAHFEAASKLGHLTSQMIREWSAVLLAANRYPEARELLQKALSTDPAQSDLRYRLASSYSSEGKWKEAWPHWEEVYRGGLRHSGVILQLARARFAVGRDVEAVDLLDSFTNSSEVPDYLWEVAKLLFDKALYRQALIPLQKLWQQTPGVYEVGMYLALSHYLVQQYAESEQVLIGIKAGADAPLDYQILVGSVRARMEKWDAAKPILENAIEKEPNRADGYLNLGLFLLERGEYDRAAQLFVTAARLANRGTKLLYAIQSRKNCAGLQPPQRVQAENFSRAELLSDLAQELHRRQQSGSAVEVYMLALMSDPGSARANAGLGKVCWELDSVSEARRFVETGLSFHPNFAPLHFNLGLIQQSMGAANDAILSYRKALELEGEKATALYWIQLGTAQQAAGQIEEAERSYRKGLELEPQLAEGHYELGKLYFYLKDLVHAEQEFQNAIELDPTLLRAYYQLGLVCSRNGKVDRGKELLNTFHRKKKLYGADDRLVEAPAGL